MYDVVKEMTTNEGESQIGEEKKTRGVCEELVETRERSFQSDFWLNGERIPVYSNSGVDTDMQEM